MSKYTCFICKKEFFSNLDNTIAEQECLDTFGVDPSETPCEVVCHDCYINTVGYLSFGFKPSTTWLERLTIWIAGVVIYLAIPSLIVYLLWRPFSG